MKKISKIGSIISLIGGLWITTVIVIGIIILADMGITTVWTWPSLLPYQLTTGIVAIIGAIISFKYVNIGSIILFVTGVFYPLFVFIFFGPSSIIMLLFGSLIYFDYLNIPFLILLIGGIVAFIEWLRE